jgi:hypothetical protein
MPGPQRYDEGVAFLPMEGLAIDDGRAAAAAGVVGARAGVAVGLGFFVGSEHLNTAGHGRQCRATGGGIDKLKGCAVASRSKRSRLFRRSGPDSSETI